MRAAAGAFLAMTALLAAANAAHAQDAPLSIVERVLPSGARPAGWLGAAAGASYGTAEEMLDMGDAHHRVAAALAIEAAPRPWLGAGLRLDGRWDRHSFAAMPEDTGWTGDPRLWVRADRQRQAGSVGARLSLWLPGREAPSVEPEAVTVEALAFGTWTPTAALALTANGGWRRARSARAVPDAAALGPGDRSALELSAFDTVLAGAGAALRRERWRLWGAALLEAPVGSGAPPFAQAPLRAQAGARFAVGAAMAFEVAADVLLSERPALTPGAPLVPLPPRLALWAALSARFGLPAPPAVATDAPPDAPRWTRLAGTVAVEGSGRRV